MNIDLTPFSIHRPERIRWFFPTSTVDPVEVIASKSTRKFVSHADEILVENNITWTYEPLSKEKYLEWLPYYEKTMVEQQHDVVAKAETYDLKVSEGKQLESMFFYQNEQLVGSAIIVRKGNAEAHLTFKATERLNLSSKSNSSIGVLIEYLFLREMNKQHVTVVTSGRSRNIFGVIYTLGYLDFKLRFGYFPRVETDTDLLSDVEVNEAGWAVFYGLKNDQLELFVILPESAPELITQIESTLSQYPKTVLTYGA